MEHWARFGNIRVFMNEMLQTMDSSVEKQAACVYLYGVSTFASMLAMKRGHHPELAAIAGLLHSFYFYKTGISEFPGPNSAEAVRPFLRDTGVFANDELLIILRAIYYHEDDRQMHGPYDEVIKDAITLQKSFHPAGTEAHSLNTLRIRKLFGELAIPNEPEREEEITQDKRAARHPADKRSLLADISEELAGHNIIGIPGNSRYREICRYWPGPDTYKELKGSWCAAFVYHCCRKAGILLPIRHPNGSCRFAGVAAWLEWARLAETGFFHEDGHKGFLPQRGDIVIYDRLLSHDSHDHIGIVLACEGKEIRVAEGNKDNKNSSSVTRRDRQRCIQGYIRIKNDYQYRFDGDYAPAIS